MNCFLSHRYLPSWGETFPASLLQFTVRWMSVKDPPSHDCQQPSLNAAAHALIDSETDLPTSCIAQCSSPAWPCRPCWPRALQPLLMPQRENTAARPAIQAARFVASWTITHTAIIIFNKNKSYCTLLFLTRYPHFSLSDVGLLHKGRQPLGVAHVVWRCRIPQERRALACFASRTLCVRVACLAVYAASHMGSCCVLCISTLYASHSLGTLYATSLVGSCCE